MRCRDHLPRPIGAAVLCLVLAACGSPGAGSSAPSGPPSTSPPGATASPTPLPALDALPIGFPARWVDHRPTALPPLTPVQGGLRGHQDGSLSAPSGQAASYTANWMENRVAAPKISCGGTAYRNVFTVADPTMTRQVTFPGWGSGSFVAAKRVVVYRSSVNGSSPPVCEELGGGTFTITFDAGPTPGTLAGTWSEGRDGTVTLVPAATATP